MNQKIRLGLTILCLLAACMLCACSAPGSGDALAEAAETIGIALLQDVQPAAASEDFSDAVQVSTVDELLAAVASDTRILLAPGEYRLTDASGYGADSQNPVLRWEEVYDGYELVIQGVSNLELIGTDPENTKILTDPRYANVLTLVNASGVRLAGLTAGHSDGQGECSGGVVHLQSCDGICVENCRLFGCGISGIQAEYTKNLSVTGTRIYECSYDAAELYFCKRVVFRDCTMDRIGVGEVYSAWGILTASECTDFAVVNCEIRDNITSNFLVLNSSRRVSVLNCGIENNTFQNAVFYVYGKGPTVEGCAFKGNSYFNWYDTDSPDSYAVGEDGNVLDAGKLAGMERREVEFALPEEQAKQGGSLNETRDADGKRTVYAATMDEFLEAIGPDTVIYLTGTEYRLDSADGYGEDFDSYYRWEEVYDGYQLVIQDVENLTITGTGAQISVVPRYANVLAFSGCTNVEISGITLGHTEAPGECAGGVLHFLSCSEIRLSSLRLFGCGILGIQAEGVSDLDVSGCEIYDCSYGGVWLFGSYGIRFRNCYLHDNGQPDFYVDGTCSDVEVDGVQLESGYYSYEGGAIHKQVTA